MTKAKGLDKIFDWDKVKLDPLIEFTPEGVESEDFVVEYHTGIKRPPEVWMGWCEIPDEETRENENCHGIPLDDFIAMLVALRDHLAERDKAK